jgi:hypothetical protein
MRRTAGCPQWDLKWNGEIRKKPKTEPVSEYIGKQRQNLRDHINIMDRIEMTNKFCNKRLVAEEL